MFAVWELVSFAAVIRVEEDNWRSISFLKLVIVLTKAAPAFFFYGVMLCTGYVVFCVKCRLNTADEG